MIDNNINNNPKNTHKLGQNFFQKKNKKTTKKQQKKEKDKYIYKYIHNIYTHRGDKMNKIKTTKKEMKQNYRILGVGYCEMQTLLKHYSPIAYHASNITGWTCDFYLINDIVISTGYNPLQSKNMVSDYNLIQDYEKKVFSVEDKEKVDKLLFELLEKLKINKIK